MPICERGTIRLLRTGRSDRCNSRSEKEHDSLLSNLQLTVSKPYGSQVYDRRFYSIARGAQLSWLRCSAFSAAIRRGRPPICLRLQTPRPTMHRPSQQNRHRRSLTVVRSAVQQHESSTSTQTACPSPGHGRFVTQQPVMSATARCCRTRTRSVACAQRLVDDGAGVWPSQRGRRPHAAVTASGIDHPRLHVRG